ncbi:MAG TPA: RimK/LysX family protein [Candidatus Limnocylindrales bacterium]|nr:RimK/LysX family protein [Candidatus Limnocylindrales bacterium]
MGKITSVFVRLIILMVMANGIAVDSVHAQALDDSRFSSPPRNEATKVTLGLVEDVVLNPWGITFPARIDTGADLSSLDARDVVVRQDVAEFRLGDRYGRQRLQLPIVDWGQVQTSMGIEKRPVVAISICLGSKLLRTPATLKDRSGMAYPFLVGRSALNGSFLVDTSRSRAAQPSCPAGAIVSN